MTLRYGSVCSGIEAASMAWHPLGWQPAFFSEIEKFPCAVLAHHYPHVPNHGDMTKFQEWPDHAIDLLVGGTPCQSFSVAGLRAGLADPRGNLMLTYLAIAARYQPRWLVWENVPGVLSSNDGRDFGTYLGALGQLGYGFAYRVLDAQFCRALGYDRAVPQRRRRVFVVGYLGDWRRAAAVFFDAASLRGNPAPRRETGKGVAPTISARPSNGGGLGTDFDLDGGLIASTGDVSHCLNAGGMGRQDFETETETETETLIVADIASTLPAGGNATGGERQPGMGAETAATMLIAFAQNQRDEVRIVPVAGALAAEPGMKQQTYLAHATQPIVPVAFNPQAGGDQTSLGYDPGSGTTQTPAVAWSIMPQNSGKDYKARAVDVAQPIMAGGPVGGNQGGDYIQEAWAVRRLTPVECCRLQGFPDDYFDQVTYRGKKPADGPIYKALGNSMAVNAMRVIGTRIALVDAIDPHGVAA